MLTNSITLPNQTLIKNFSWRDVHTANFSFNLPFTLSLSGGEILFAEKMLRIIPKKRMVIQGTWQQKPVVAKLFFSNEKAKHHMDKDVAGVKILQGNNIPTPPLFFQGISEDRRIYVLIFERIFADETIESLWHNRKDIEDILPKLKLIVTEIATQHVLGVVQHDLHLKNFLFLDQKIYTLDGAQIQHFSPLLPKKASISNLALFLAQLGVGIEEYQQELFSYYAKLRGWRIKQDDISELFFQIKKYNVRRWERFAKKIFRSCSDFSKFRMTASNTKCTMTGTYNRQYECADLRKFLENPDAVFSAETTTILKAGRSATVAKIILDQYVLVVKRYNIKNIWHRLRRSFRHTRAYLSWRISQKLNLFGVTTAKPVAFIEQKRFGFRGPSYYVTEYISSKNASDFFTDHIEDEKKTMQMIKSIAHLLKSIHLMRLTHGDLKITNILVNANDQPYLIDLDGAKEHFFSTKLQSTWRKDIKRFLKNFQYQLTLREKFSKILQKV